jgi:hypothetical protein
MFWILVLGFGVGVQRTIATLRRAYETASAESLVPFGVQRPSIIDGVELGKKLPLIWLAFFEPPYYNLLRYLQ